MRARTSRSRSRAESCATAATPRRARDAREMTAVDEPRADEHEHRERHELDERRNRDDACTLAHAAHVDRGDAADREQNYGRTHDAAPCGRRETRGDVAERGRDA